VSGATGVNTTLTVQDVSPVPLKVKPVVVEQAVPAVSITREYAEVAARLKVTGVVDVLVTVTVCGVLIDPTPGSAKSNDAGETVGW
jgi:hypothetical protein